MERAVTYSVVARKKPNDLEGSAKYYALAQARGEMGIREMADRIQQMCTVTRADTMAVLISLGTVMRDGLCAGEIVRLGDLGSFQIGLNGEGSVTEEEYHRTDKEGAYQLPSGSRFVGHSEFAELRTCAGKA